MRVLVEKALSARVCLSKSLVRIPKAYFQIVRF